MRLCSLCTRETELLVCRVEEFAPRATWVTLAYMLVVYVRVSFARSWVQEGSLSLVDATRGMTLEIVCRSEELGF
jgi:hypothetical protein